MATTRLSQLAEHLTFKEPPKHPLDPLDAREIAAAVAIVRADKGSLCFNTVTLLEPRKKDMLKWLEDTSKPRPARVADVIATTRDGQVHDIWIDLGKRSIVKAEIVDNVQPTLIVEEMLSAEGYLRKDPRVIEQCGIIGIPPESMDKVFCDPWTITHDPKYGTNVRAIQALLYYRPNLDDSQYAFPLDFYPIFDILNRKVIDMEIPPVRRHISLAEPNNYHMPDIEREGGYRTDLKPINITQPEGVSFTLEGRTIRWQNWSIHIGFNYREGIVLNNITFYDKFEGKERPLFYRLSIAEMVVPYGSPHHPHHRKHAFDLGEYGAGNLTNSLSLGCDCKGAIHYMDAELPTQAGGVRTIKNAICIHEEDAGILFKHTDFRDDSTIVTRGRKLIISQIFTAANYEYCIYWTFLQDGTVQLDIKLTGILNTTAMNVGEDLEGYGTEVYTGVNAHNHQHLFCLRVDPNIDGQENTIFQSDAVRSPYPVGHEKNKWGNGFTAAKTKFTNVTEAMSDYDASTSRTWDIANENKINKHSKKPVSYKLVSRESAPLMPKEGSLVWKRAGFARHTVHVTKYKDDQLHPAGRHVVQTSGEPSVGLPAWIAENPKENIENTDVVLWHTFGITHFATPEDFPVMPAEPITLLLRPRNFFERNPCMDVPPSYNITPTQVKEGKKGCACAASKESVRV